jgi:hypothetical protein
MTPLTQRRFQRIVSFLEKKQAATVKQISAATNLPVGTVRQILDYQIHFGCHKVAGKSTLFSLREPLPAKEKEKPSPARRLVNVAVSSLSPRHPRLYGVVPSGGRAMAKSEAERRAIFLALVEAQDAGDNGLQSRKAIAKRFKIREGLVRQIESEGIEANWPPLE